MRVLVTGGAGFIGAKLAARLGQGGHDVLILDNISEQVHGADADFEPPPWCDFIRADVRDREAVFQAMRDVDVLCHLAAETGVGQSQYRLAHYVSVNTLGTANVVEVAAHHGVKQVILASSRAVYGEGVYRCRSCQHVVSPPPRESAALDEGRWDVVCGGCGGACEPVPIGESASLAPASIYGITKLQQEELVAQVARTGAPAATILRFFNVYGPGQSLHNPYTGVLGTFFRQAILGQQLEVYEDGQMLRDFVYVEDVVDVIERCVGNPSAYGQILNVGTGNPLTLLQIAKEMLRVLGKPQRVRISGRYRVGDVRHVVADTTLVSTILGYLPATSFADGLREYTEWAEGFWASIRPSLSAVADSQAVGSGNPDRSVEDELLARSLLRQGKQ